MNKFTITLALIAGIGLNAGAQSLKKSKLVAPVITKQTAPSVSRSGNASLKNQNQGVLLKNGGASAVNVAFTDDFSLPNDTDGLKARGYLPYYRGTGPQGTTGAWFQGNSVNWGDYNNGSSEYVCSNYQSVTGTNDIDNWLVLPALNISTGDVISFYSRSPLNSTYPDSIRVMYSDVGDSIPEATTWVELGRFEVNITGVWLQNMFIAPTAGTTARFAIRYAVADGGPTGNNSDLIGIDQLDVYTPASIDMEALDINPLNTEYTMLPLTQAAPVTLSGTVKNNGLNATTGGSALFEVVDTVTSAVVFTETVAIPNLTPGSTAALSTTGTFTPTGVAYYRPRLTVTYSGDTNVGNDVAASFPTAITDSVFARDNNQTTGSLGIGAGPADGIVGQNFTVSSQTYLTSVSFFLTDGMDPNPSGSPVYATIHAQTPGSEPSSTVLATTTTLLVTPGLITTGGQWFTLPISGASLQLSPGLYYVGIHEVDSILTLGTTGQLVTPNTVWVTWNSIPSPPAVNGWAMADDFNFFITYNLRMNFGTPTAINNVEANSGLVSVYPSPAFNDITISLNSSLKKANVEIYNSLGSLVKTVNNVEGLTKVDVSNYAKGVYTVKVFAGNKVLSQRFSVVK